MAVSSWLYRRRLVRYGYGANKEKKEEKELSLIDPTKDYEENTLRLLSQICRGQGLTDQQKLLYLKSLNQLIDENKKSDTVFFMKNEHIFRCLKTCLTSKNSSLRSGGYRVIRNCLSTAEDVVILNNLQIPQLLIRSIDMGLSYEDERIQAFRLIVKILVLNPQRFCVGMTRSLISLAESINETKDKTANSSVVILCYLCILNPELLVQCYGHYALLKCSLEVSDARLNECMLICLMFLMNRRELRARADIHLDYVISAYTEWEKRSLEKETAPPYRINELSVLTILRSWIGIYHFCQPNTPGIKVIVDVLYLHRDDLRKAILELLYQIFGLDRKLWTDKINVAIANIDPSKRHESWKINHRFIVAEGKDILLHKNFYRPNLSEIHTALVLYAFVESGILPALVEVIVSPDPFLSIRALILLGVILHLSYKLLPAEIVDLDPGLPTLAEYITQGSPYQRSQALTAVSALHKINEVLKRKPTPKSLFLKQLVYYSESSKDNDYQGESGDSNDNEETEEKDIESPTDSTRSEDKGHEIHQTLNFYFLQLEFERKNRKREINSTDLHIHKSNVLWYSDYREWDWDRIETSLKSTDESFVRLQEAYHKNYIKKIVNFYKPSSRLYSDIEQLENSENKSENNENIYDRKELDIITTTALYLVDFLLLSDEGGKGKILDDLLSDMSKELKEVVVNESLYTIYFNPRHMINTMSQYYFLIIGRLTSTEKGVKALKRRSLLKMCTEIVCSCRHEYYVKLIISSLNYNIPGRTRVILAKALCSTVESVRTYATELLLILARLDVRNFSKWGIELLISLMYNNDKTIATTSINILQELCYDNVYLESVLEAKPSVLHLADKGNLLLVRFLSNQSGFLFLSKANYVEAELLKWEQEYNHRYVRLIEDELNNVFTLCEVQDYERNFKRLSYKNYKHDDVFIPFHLYGELSKHEKGFQCLVRNGHIFKMAKELRRGLCDSDLEVLELKSSLWGLSNMSTSKLGFEFLEKENIIQTVVKIANSCPVLSVRATAFYCLNLISTTVAGADALEEYGWYSVRRNRSEEWPPMDVPLSLVNDVWRSRLGENDSTSFPVVSSPDIGITDSDRVPELPEINSDSSSERTLTLSQRFFKKFKSSNRGSCDDTQYVESENEISTYANEDVLEESQGPSHSDPYFKKYNSPSNTSFDGSSEGVKRSRLWEALTFQKLRSLYRKRKKSNAKSEPEFKFEEESYSLDDLADTAPSCTSSQLDFVTESTPEMPTDKFVLAYKGVSLPKSLSQIFTNEPKSDSDTNGREQSPTQPKENTFQNNVAETEMGRKSEGDSVDSSNIPDNIEDYEQFRALGPHSTETCIGCCTKVREKIVTELPRESDQIKTEESSNNETENAIPLPGPSSGDPPVDDEANSKEETVPSEETSEEKKNDTDAPPDAEKSSEANKEVAEPQNTYRIVVNQIMKQMDRMFNPVIVKAAKHELTLLRRRYPVVFRDVCLYSNVCNLLSSSSCRVTSRYFIQQLFSDVNYPMVYDDAQRTLRLYVPANTSTMADILPYISEPHSSTYKYLPLQLYTPPRTKTIIANAARVEGKNPFDDVPVTYYLVEVREADAETKSADFVDNSSQN